MKQLGGTIISIALHWGLLYLWQVKGLEGAGNVLVAWLWLINLIAIFLLPFGKVNPRPPAPVWLRAVLGVRRLIGLVFVGAMAWVGNIALAILMLLVMVWLAALSTAGIKAWREQRSAK